ncbi:hypothetical protein ACFLZ2_00935 [Candidatus Margulisiibacteriota bacterium]
MISGFRKLVVFLLTAVIFILITSSSSLAIYTVSIPSPAAGQVLYAGATATFRVNHNMPVPVWTGNPETLNVTVQISDNNFATATNLRAYAHSQFAGIEQGAYTYNGTDYTFTVPVYNSTNVKIRIYIDGRIVTVYNPTTIPPQIQFSAFTEVYYSGIFTVSTQGPGQPSAPQYSASGPDLTWVPAPYSAAYISYYKIYRNNVHIDNSSSPSYSDTNVPEGTYIYKVSAVYTSGIESNQSLGTQVIVDGSVPTAPSLLPINVSGPTLNWIAVTDTCGIDHYNVYRNADPAIEVDHPNTSYIDANAPEGDNVYQITAVDNLGRESGLSEQRNVIVDHTPPTVNDFSVDGGNTVTDINITLNIDIPEPASELANNIYIKEGAGDWVAYPNSTTSVPWILTKRDYAAEQAAVEYATMNVTVAEYNYQNALTAYDVKDFMRNPIFGTDTGPFSAHEIMDQSIIDQFSPDDQGVINSRYQSCMSTYQAHQVALSALAAATAVLNAPDTERQLEIKVEDTAGNITYKSLTVELALTPTFSDIAVNGTSISALSFSTQKSEITAVVRNVYEITSENVKLNIDGQEIDVNSGLVITPIAGEDGAYDLYYQTPEPLSASSHTIVFTATDVYGNEGTSTVSLSMAGVLGVTGKPKIVPNPFAPRTQTVDIQYTLSGNMDITLMVYDVTGRSVWRKSCPTGTNGGQAGANNVVWDGRDSANHFVGNGAYVYFITAKGKVLSRGNLAVLD